MKEGKPPSVMPFLLGVLLGMWGRWCLLPAWGVSLVAAFFIGKHFGGM